MRIKTIAGLAFAGAAAAVVVAGGVAYASDEPGSGTTVKIVNDEGATGTAVDDRECPEKSGENQQPAEAENL
jgi:hypothetical protein